MQAHELPKGVLDAIVEVLARNPNVQRACLFGSRARGTAREGSDIDLCVMGRALDLDQLLELEQQLDALDLPWKVDLLAWHLIDDPQLRERIAQEGVTLLDRQARGQDGI